MSLSIQLLNYRRLKFTPKSRFYSKTCFMESDGLQIIKTSRVNHFKATSAGPKSSARPINLWLLAVTLTLLLLCTESCGTTAWRTFFDENYTFSINLLHLR